jgi:Prokaryotic Cytochrome C oxidase subunit IV
MTRGVPVRATAVWMLLMAATALTWWLGADHGADLGGGRTWVALAIPVAFLKVYLIGSEFMEVRTAPRALRLVFGAWVMVLTVALTLIYLL